MSRSGCEIFYQASSPGTCYTGNFGYTSGGYLGTTSDSYYRSPSVGESFFRVGQVSHAIKTAPPLSSDMTFAIHLNHPGPGNSCPTNGGNYDITSSTFSLTLDRTSYGNNEDCVWSFANYYGGTVRVFFPTFEVCGVAAAAAATAATTLYLVS